MSLELPRPGIAVAALVALVVLAPALGWPQSTVEALEREGGPGVKLVVEPVEETPLPVGTIAYEVLDLGGGLAILAYNTVSGRPTAILVEEGVLVWSVELEGLEPLGMEYRAGYLHAYTRDRIGALEVVRYYRLSLEGEALEERGYTVGRGYLAVSAALTTAGLVVAGSVYSIETGWDPFIAVVDPLAGLVGIHAARLEGDQEAVSMEVDGGTVCVAYYTPEGGPAGWECASLPGLTPLEEASWRVDAPPAAGAAAGGGCLALAGEEGLLLAHPGGLEGPLAGGRPIAALEVPVEGLGRALAVAGSVDGTPWIMVGVMGRGCVEGYIEGAVSSSPGAIVSLDPALDGGFLASITRPGGGATLVKYEIKIFYLAGAGPGGAGEEAVNGADRRGGAQGVVGSPALTAALLASLLALLAAAILLRRGAPR